MRRRTFLTGSAAAALGAGLASLPVWAAGGRQAPDIRGDGTWLNSGALSMAGLRAWWCLSVMLGRVQNG